ncbi:hypothetical protein ACS0TY_034763 [Phlomoides rotata]
MLCRVANDVEHHLTILGASGIEDKLQQGVLEANECLRTAGIKVWVLTGDKQEMAISIGYSSKLLTMSKKLVSHSDATSGGSGDSQLALIIDGTSLIYILDSELENELFELACNCSVIFCCRVAPLQKAGIVALIKSRTDDMTLSLGDGANDISIIQMADVGIGISGQEGRHAVMTSDFAMGQFRFLVHGHWNYQRMSYMILYNFYKNAVFVLLLFRYALFMSFTLTSAIIDWSSVLYSVIYTSVPTIIVGVLDKNLSRTSLLKHPQLYGAGQRQKASWSSLHRTALPLSNYYSSIKINQLDMIDARGYNRSKISSRAIEAYLIQILKTGFLTRERLSELFYAVYEKEVKKVRRSVKFFLENLLNERLTQQQTLSAIGEVFMHYQMHAILSQCPRYWWNSELYLSPPTHLPANSEMWQSRRKLVGVALAYGIFGIWTKFHGQWEDLSDIWQGIEFSQSKLQVRVDGLTGVMFSDVARIEEAVEELQEIGLRWMTEKEVISGKASFFFCPLFY